MALKFRKFKLINSTFSIYSTYFKKLYFSYPCKLFFGNLPVVHYSFFHRTLKMDVIFAFSLAQEHVLCNSGTQSMPQFPAKCSIQVANSYLDSALE